MASYAKVKNSHGEYDMVCRFESKEDMDKVIADLDRRFYYKPVSERWANDFVIEHGARWTGPFTYYGGTPLDGISFYHTIYD